jgi:hypothetical protein
LRLRAEAKGILPRKIPFLLGGGETEKRGKKRRNLSTLPNTNANTVMPLAGEDVQCVLGGSISQ